jgi:hypothetical protein
MVMYLAIACVGLLFSSYVPFIVIGMCLTSLVNNVVGFVELRLFNLWWWNVLIPRGVQLLWRRFRIGDSAVRESLLRHKDLISTLLTLFFFVIFVIALPVYLTLSVYYETRDMGAIVGELWVNKSDYVPAYVSDKLAEIHVYVVTEGVSWVDKRLFNTTGLTLSMLNNTLFVLTSKNASAANAALSDQPTSWGDISALLVANLSTLTTLLVHIREHGQVILNYAIYALYTALRYKERFCNMSASIFTNCLPGCSQHHNIICGYVFHLLHITLLCS